MFMPENDLICTNKSRRKKYSTRLAKKQINTTHLRGRNNALVLADTRKAGICSLLLMAENSIWTITRGQKKPHQKFPNTSVMSTADDKIMITALLPPKKSIQSNSPRKIRKRLLKKSSAILFWLTIFHSPYSVSL
jgi:hypothetical protein